MDATEAQKLVDANAIWHHKFEIHPGVWTPGSYDPGFMIPLLNLPEDLSGKTALDIGASDGFYSAELARRGAKVTALDYRAKTFNGFWVTEKVRGFEARHVHANVNELDKHITESFDIILFLGVLYHLPDMLGVLWKIRQRAKGTVYVETYCQHDLSPEIPAARYWPASSLNNDLTNFWAPNRLCVLGNLEDAGFKIKSDHSFGDRLLVECDASGPPDAYKMEVAYGLLDTKG